MSEEKKLSTTRLAEQARIEVKQLFKLLAEQNWIVREDNQWRLTTQGEYHGGSYLQSDKYGEYIVWPESLVNHSLLADFQEEWLTATRLGEKLGLAARRVNMLLSELGWLEKDQRGWMITERGTQLGGDQRNGKQGFYVVWPGAVQKQPELVAATDNLVSDTLLQALDGRQCVNVAERKISNFLYLYHIAHATQRQIQNSEYKSSFFIPARKVYIEYWGFDQSAGSLSSKLEKQEYYKKHKLKLIELSDEDVDQLDDVLPQKLLQFGIQV